MTDQPSLPKRDWRRAAWLGLRGSCPSCGEARLFARWLKPHDHCPHCAQDWSHQCADDFPAYLVIIVLGHLIVPLVVEVNLHDLLSMGVQMVLWPTLIAVLALLLIGPAKGAVIAVQWALRMHGFETKA